MNLAEPTVNPTLDVPAQDELLHWELRVAQRADELARETPHGRDGDLACWLKAEHEVFANFSAGAALNR